MQFQWLFQPQSLPWHNTCISSELGAHPFGVARESWITEPRTDKLGMFLSSIYILNNFLQCLCVTGNSNSPKKTPQCLFLTSLSQKQGLHTAASRRAFDKKGVG